MSNNISIPSLYELYNAVTNDCYYYLYSKCDENVRKSIVNFITVIKKDKPILNNMIYILRYYTRHKRLKSDIIISFTSKYIYNMFLMTSDELIKNKKVNDNNEYCLAYIALLGYKYTFEENVNEQDNFFNFKIEEYTTFSTLLNNYEISKQIEEYYESSISNINKKSANDKLLALIKTFDHEQIFINDLILEISYHDSSFKENDLNSTKNDSTEKEKKENSKEINLTENISTNMNDKFKEINLIENINNNELNKNPLTDEYPKADNINNIEIKNKNDEQEKNVLENNLKNEINKNNIFDVVLNIQKELKGNKIEARLEFIHTDIKFIEAYDIINYESIFNSKYLKVQKKNIEYLEQYIFSLKNTIINLSNPYDFNFWRKLANIILKNIFIILNMKKFDIRQQKKRIILNQLYSKFKEKNIYINEEIKKKLLDYEKDLEFKNETNTKNISDAADKKRDYNLITIYKNEKPDIISSLSIDFLFYLKEKGNKFNHFDEVVLNHILFNDLNIEENEFDFREEDEENKEIKKNSKEIKIETDNNNKKEQRENINNDKKEVKIENNKNNEEKKRDNNTNNKEEIKKEIVNSDKKEIKKNEEKSYKEKKDKDNDNKDKIDSMNKKIDNNENKTDNICENKIEIKIELNDNKIKNETSKIIENRTKENNNLNNKEKNIYKGNDLIKMLKNPLYFQKKNIQKVNIFSSIYTEIDNLKIDVENKINYMQKIELVKNIKDVKSKIKELKNLIENYFETYKIDIKKIEILKNDKQSNLDDYTKRIIDIYSELESLNNKIDEKIKLHEEIDKKLLELNISIANNENKIDEEIKKIQTVIEKIAKLIKFNHIFDEYKQDLKNKIKNDNEYKTHPDIYNEKNVDEFTIDKLCNFLQEHLNYYSFSIRRKNITNYNLYIEIIKNFPKLYQIYKDDIDVHYKISN